MNELALFAGAGGGILGGKLLGWKTVCAVEINEYARSSLIARQDDGSLPAFPIWDDVRTFDGVPWRGVVDIVTGGFPCQDISAAGKGAGITGERSGLWKEFARIIREVGPRFVFVENSPLLTKRGLHVVLGDLAAMGYDAKWGVLGAADAIWDSGDPCADHVRYRIWIVGEFAESNLSKTRPINSVFHADGPGLERKRPPQSEGRIGNPEPIGASQTIPNAMCDGTSEGSAEVRGSGFKAEKSQRRRRGGEPSNSGRNDESIPNANGAGLENRGSAREQAGSAIGERGTPQPKSQRRGCTWWASEPGLGRVADVVANRLVRIAAIGNGQVPAVVRLAWETLS